MKKINNDFIAEYERIQKRDRCHKIILIAIIIILLLLWLLCWRLGKIGYNTEPLPSDPVFNEQLPTIKVSDNETEITDNTDLNIFANEKFNGESIIAPKSSGEYKFVIDNIADTTLAYDIEFKDIMSNPINMKYRLKIDNIYIRGNENEYIDISELSVDDIVVLEDSNNIFTLEWYWEDDDTADTYVGSLKSDGYYTLELMIKADVYEK